MSKRSPTKFYKNSEGVVYCQDCVGQAEGDVQEIPSQEISAKILREDFSCDRGCTEIGLL